MLCIRNDIFYYSFDFKVLEFQIWIYVYYNKKCKSQKKENVFDRVIIGPCLRYGSQYNDPKCVDYTCALMQFVFNTLKVIFLKILFYCIAIYGEIFNAHVLLF